MSFMFVLNSNNFSKQIHFLGPRVWMGILVGLGGGAIAAQILEDYGGGLVGGGGGVLIVV